MDLDELSTEYRALTPGERADAIRRLRAILPEVPDSHAEMRPVVTAFLLGASAP